MSRFDDKLDRRGTNCMKWDAADKAFESQDVIPMWVADMDFPAPRAVTEALARRATHGAFGYPIVPQSYYDAIINWMDRRRTRGPDPWPRGLSGSETPSGRPCPGPGR